jgi:ribosomal protein S27E
MPYLHCPRCYRTAWVRARVDGQIACRRCGTTLDVMAGGDARFLAAAVRERLARDARRSDAPPRFIRDTQRLPD